MTMTFAKQLFSKDCAVFFFFLNTIDGLSCLQLCETLRITHKGVSIQLFLFPKDLAYHLRFPKLNFNRIELTELIELI